jgi:flavin reductase (DIM6/NTAB) family NADH-FMN oxidoreductase RutF
MVKMSVPLENWLNLVVTNPCILITTVDPYGNVDGMPGKVFATISYWPPMVLIGVAPFEHTYMNIRDTGEFVVNLASMDHLQKIWIMAQRFPRRINKVELADFSEISSEKVRPPRIQECKVHLECKTQWMKRAGDHFAITGLVVAASADKDALTEDYHLILDKVKQVHHLGFSGIPFGPDFVGLDREVFHIGRLGSTKYEIAPFREWLAEMKERVCVTPEKMALIKNLSKKLEKGKPEEYGQCKKELALLLREIIEATKM